MRFFVLTIFPEIFRSFWEHGIIRRALIQERIHAAAVNIRDFAEGPHRVTDDRPYGGGCGMVMKPEPLAAAIHQAMSLAPQARRILLTPQGRVFNQALACDLAMHQGLILVCGRYEGVDERVVDTLIDDEISIGDYILTGGEVAAMVVMDAVSRLIPGVLGGSESAAKDSFSDNLLEHAHYTRPERFEGEAVPAVLASGNHAEIERWRLESALIRTLLKRKDLLKDKILSEPERKILEKWLRDIEEIVHTQSLLGADTLPGNQ